MIPLPVRKGLGSIHTSFRNRGPLRYNLVKLLLQWLMVPGPGLGEGEGAGVRGPTLQRGPLDSEER